jgi:WbqC-like protein
MRVAIMQPYFLPYQGYWQLFSNVDAFILFDLVEYKKRSWMSRNRILTPDPSKESAYINLPVVRHGSKLIKDARVLLEASWLRSIEGSLSVYKRMRAESFEDTIALVRAMSSMSDCSLSEFVRYQCEKVLSRLGIDTPIFIASELCMDLDSKLDPGDWALEIAKQYGATEYLNPPSGYRIFDPKQFESEGIALKFLKPTLSPYRQGRRSQFVEGLSIIDMLMFLNDELTRERIHTDCCIYDWYQLDREAKVRRGNDCD